MLVRLLPLALLASLVTGCQDEPEAKYPMDLRPCQLIPAATSEKLLDIGPALGPAEERETQFVVQHKYCRWEYEQPNQGFLKNSPKRGVVERVLTLDVSVSEHVSQAIEWYAKVSEKSQPVTGPGEQAAWKSSKFNSTSDTVMFRRSNAVVTVELRGTDCCSGGWKRDMRAGPRKKQVLEAAAAADRYLLAYR